MLMLDCISEESPKRLDALLSFIPDQLLDKAIAAKKDKGQVSSDQQPISFQDILQLVREGDLQVQDHLFDSMAMRLLIFQRPQGVEQEGGPVILSSLMKKEGEGVARVLVQSALESKTLTVAMNLQDELVSQYRSSPRLEAAWRLKSISGDEEGEGEDEEEGVAGPGLEVGPESIVLRQMRAAKRGDVAGIWRYASPANKAATGPLSRFEKVLSSPMYSPLMNHASSESLKRIQMTHKVYAEVVGVKGSNGQKYVYVWSVERFTRSPGGGVIEGEDEGWRVNSVQLVSATQPEFL